MVPCRREVLVACAVRWCGACARHSVIRQRGMPTSDPRSQRMCDLGSWHRGTPSNELQGIVARRLNAGRGIVQYEGVVP
jgi:hypothetical protein